MKRVIFLAVLLSRMGVGHGQSYFVDLGAAATREQFHDGRVLVAPGSVYPDVNLVVGVTNTGGFDQVVLTSLDNVYGTTHYQKKFKLSWPVLSKPADRIEVNSVRLAYDEPAAASNFLMVGSYLRKNSTGSTVLGRGIFTAFVNLASGNISSIKRWETTLPSVSHISVASATAHAGSYYFTGNIYASNAPNHMWVVALNGSNNLIWNKVDQWESGYGDLNVQDILFSPYQPVSLPEVVVVGSTRPVAGSPLAQALFMRRYNAGTGAVLGQYLLNSPGSPTSLSCAGFTPARNNAGIYDGFLISGTRSNTTLVDRAWVTKVDPTGATVIWSKEYEYNLGGSLFAGGDITEVNEAPHPNSAVFVGTNSNGISGTTTDAVITKIDANGNVIYCTSITPSSAIGNLHEEAWGIQKSRTEVLPGFCVYGNRTIPSNSQQSNMFAALFVESSDAIYCDFTTTTPIAASNIATSASVLNTLNGPGLASAALNQTNEVVAMLTHHCWSDMLVEKRNVTQPVLAQRDVDVYPNPSSGEFHLNVASKEEARVEVHTVTGQRILLPQVVMGPDARVDLGAYPSGVYVIRIVQAGQSRVFRVVKE